MLHLYYYCFPIFLISSIQHLINSLYRKRRNSDSELVQANFYSRYANLIKDSKSKDNTTTFYSFLTNSRQKFELKTFLQANELELKEKDSLITQLISSLQNKIQSQEEADIKIKDLEEQVSELVSLGNHRQRQMNESKNLFDDD